MQRLGYIKLHRRIQDNWIWKEKREFSKAEAWIDILMAVQHDIEPQIVVLGMNTCICNRGESLKSLETWGSRWNWHKSKVRRFMMLLQKQNMIELKSETVTTRLKVQQYELYQGERNADETQTKRKRNADETQMKTDNNVKNDNNVKKELEGKLPSNYATFINLFNELTHRKFQYTDKKALRQFEYLIKQGYKREDFTKVILNAYTDQYHMEQSFKYLTPEFITRTNIFERYLNLNTTKARQIEHDTLTDEERARQFREEMDKASKS